MRSHSRELHVWDGEADIERAKYLGTVFVALERHTQILASLLGS